MKLWKKWLKNKIIINKKILEKNIDNQSSKLLGTLNYIDCKTQQRKQIVYCFLGDYYPVYVAENGELFIDLPTGKIDMTKHCKMSTIVLNENEKTLPINTNAKSINITNRKLEDFDINNSEFYYCNKINIDNNFIIVNGLRFMNDDKLAINMDIFRYHNLTDKNIQEWRNEIDGIKQQCKKLKKKRRNSRKVISHW